MRCELARITMPAVAAATACIAVFAAHGAGIVVSSILVVVLGLAVTCRFARSARRHELLVRELRRRSDITAADGTTIRAGDFGGSAFVGGLHHPEIFVDAAVLAGLSDDERRAVILHERHHQVRRDPLRMMGDALVRPFVVRTPRGRQWLVDREARREIMADQYAINHGASVGALARSLVKVSPAGVGMAGFAGVLDLRISALAGEDHPPPARVVRWAMAFGLLVGVGFCLGAIHASWIFCCP